MVCELQWDDFVDDKQAKKHFGSITWGSCKILKHFFQHGIWESLCLSPPWWFPFGFPHTHHTKGYQLKKPTSHPDLGDTSAPDHFPG